MHSIRNTLKQLMEYDIFRSYHNTYKKGWRYDFIPEFRMLNIPSEKWGRPYLLPFAEYLDHVEKTMEDQADPFASIQRTAVHILLPKPTRFSESPAVQKKLEAVLEELEHPEENWNYAGYAAFAIIDSQSVCEFHIPWRVREYFQQLLTLKETGEIDYIKSETYARRMQDHDKG